MHSPRAVTLGRRSNAPCSQEVAGSKISEQGMGKRRMKKIALFRRMTGQDGAYRAERLQSKGCEVHEIKRRSSFLARTALITFKASRQMLVETA
jgi:hypothetical protein